MHTEFSAAAPTLGYLYQAQYALYALLKEDREEAQLAIEGLDDITIEHDQYIELSQLKHHVRQKATMTAASPELWKTIRIWSTLLKDSMWKPDETRLTLITTATATAGSLPTLLFEDGRDTVEAHRLLLETATKSKSTSLTDSFKAFSDLTKAQQIQLIDAIYIYDESPTAKDLPALIKKQFHWGVPTGKVDLVYERLQGWWFERVVSHLLGKSTQKIKQLELKIKIDDIISQFQRDSLPVDHARTKIDVAYFNTQKNKLFVQQLNHIEVNTHRIHFAVQDYFRAFEQRTRWAKDMLLIDDELNQYEDILKEEWGRYMAQMMDQLDGPDALDDEAACVRFGKDVLAWMERVRIPIRKNMPPNDEYVMRGSYHMMANEEVPPVYWHPKLLEKLEKAVAATTQHA